MSPLDTQLRDAAATPTQPLDHDALQRRGRTRRTATRAGVGLGVVALVAGVGLVVPRPDAPSIDPIGPGAPSAGQAPAGSPNPDASDASSVDPSPAPTTPPAEREAPHELRAALDREVPAGLEVDRVRHVRVVSAMAPRGAAFDEWSRLSVSDHHVDGDELTVAHASATLREATTTADLRALLADVGPAEGEALQPDPADDRYVVEGEVERSTGAVEGRRQLQEAQDAASSGARTEAALRLADAMLSLSDAPEGEHWRGVVDVLDQLDADGPTVVHDVLAREIVVLRFATDLEGLDLLFDPHSGQPVGIDIVVDSGEVDEDGVPLLWREVVLVP